jgi:hypothetical protein
MKTKLNCLKVLFLFLFFLSTSAYAQITQTMPVTGCSATPTNPAPANAEAVARYRVELLQRFGQQQSCQFAHNPQIDQIVANMTQWDLARLSVVLEQSYLYTLEPCCGGGTTYQVSVPAFLAGAVPNLSAASLVKIRAAFGSSDVDAAVNAYSSDAIKTAYFAASQIAPYPTSRAQVISVGQKVQLNTTVTVLGAVTPNPLLDMTVYEIYLDYVTAGWSTAASLTATAKFVGGNISSAFIAGYTIGTGIYWIIDQTDPDINIWIGDQIGNFVIQVCDASGANCR